MSKNDAKKSGRPAGIDQDYLHGVCRMAYVRGLIWGGTKEEDIAKRLTPKKLERDSTGMKGIVKYVLEALMQRGDISPDVMLPTKEDKKRYNDDEELILAGMPIDEDRIKEEWLEHEQERKAQEHRVQEWKKKQAEIRKAERLARNAPLPMDKVETDAKPEPKPKGAIRVRERRRPNAENSSHDRNTGNK